MMFSGSGLPLPFTGNAVFVLSGYVKMSWAVAVWIEGDCEFERVIPSNWIVDRFIRWPPGNNAKPCLKRRDEPTEQWKTFPLVKVKLRSGKKITQLLLFVN